jgi:hypothetical protein
MPLNGHVNVPPGLIQSARDTLYTSGSLSKHSKLLNSVLEAPGELYKARS